MKVRNAMKRIRTDTKLPDGDIIDLFLVEEGENFILTDLSETFRWVRTNRDCSCSDEFRNKVKRKAKQLLINLEMIEKLPEICFSVKSESDVNSVAEKMTELIVSICEDYS